MIHAQSRRGPPSAAGGPILGFAALFACRTVLSVQWNGMIPLLPVYGSQLGIRPSTTGVYLAVSYAALIVGMLVAGRLSDASRHSRVPLLVVVALNVPAVYVIGRAATSLHFLASVAGAGFLQGAGIALISALAGRTAERSVRGRVYTVLSVPIGLGAFLGGMITGPVADARGFEGMFLILAGVCMICPLCVLLLPRATGQPSRSPETQRHSGPPAALWSTGLALLLLVNVLAMIGRVGGRIGTSIVMDQLGFSASWISATAAISGLVALPFLIALGTLLSDRFRRSRLLASCYLLGGLGLAILSVATTRWHFLVSSSLLSFLAYSSTGIGSAYAADLAPPHALGRAVSLFGATVSVAGVVGNAAVGYALERLGSTASFAGLALLALLPASVMWIRSAADATSSSPRRR